MALQQQAWADHGRRRYKAALPAALRAFDLDPNADLANLLADLHANLRMPCDGVLDLMLAADLDPSEPARDYIDKTLPILARKCDRKLGWVRIEATPAGARVRVGGVEFQAPRTVGLRAGEHTVDVSAPGHEAVTRTLEVRAGHGATERYTLAAVAPPVGASKPVQVEKPQSTPEPTPVIPEPVTPAPVRKGHGLRNAGWTLLATGLAAAATGAGMTVWGQAAVDEADDLSSNGATVLTGDDLQRWKDLNAKSDRRQAAATALYAIGGAALVSGVVMVVVGSRRTRPSAATVRVDPLLGREVGAMLTWALP
ncbi:MAG: PEGA domain-containing protein [Deltaproteobacteria bacterium]|nr:PEGA domain-containing protein [Deltaproteobacteria bacterium]